MARPRTYPHDLRDRLLGEAAERLARSGPEAVSVRDLAASQGTSTNAIYTMFGSKGELLRDVVRAASESFVRVQVRVLDEHPGVAGLVKMAYAYRLWALGHPALYRIMFGGLDLPGPERDAKDRAAMQPLVRKVEELLDAGLLSPGEVLPICVSLWAVLHGWVMLETMLDGSGIEADLPRSPLSRFDEYVILSLEGWLTAAGREQLAAAASER